uniref:Uncharacterized protein n=1 Tax=Oryza glumipatula TaxID=40148 RepID=A0A0D9Y543_9ORYZ
MNREANPKAAGGGGGGNSGCCSTTTLFGALAASLSSRVSCPVCRGKAAPADELADAIVARIAVTPDLVGPRVSMSVVVPVEMLKGEMVGASSTSRAASAPPEQLDAQAPGPETDLETSLRKCMQLID